MTALSSMVIGKRTSRLALVAVLDISVLYGRINVGRDMLLAATG